MPTRQSAHRAIYALPWCGEMRCEHPVGQFDSPYRYAWPAELDLMAQIAGMALRDRWADWDRSPFTSQSTKHISVWEMIPT